MREDVAMLDKGLIEQLVGADDNHHAGPEAKAENVPVLLTPRLELLPRVLQGYRP